MSIMNDLYKDEELEIGKILFLSDGHGLVIPPFSTSLKSRALMQPWPNAASVWVCKRSSAFAGVHVLVSTPVGSRSLFLPIPGHRQLGKV